MHLFIKISACLVLGLITACGGSSSSSDTTEVKPPVDELPVGGAGMPIPDNRYLDKYQILLVGNSHVTANRLPNMISLMLKIGTNKEVYAVVAPGWAYLDERVNDGVTLATLRSNDWSHVIWQAQKYSTTGQYSYSTDAAKFWIAHSKQQQASPIMFPEHPRQSNREEGMRVYLLHREIASAESACVAPVGPAWDTAVLSMPQVSFHSDGNHASVAGSFLTALLFYQVISGEVAEDLPYIAEINVPQQLQTELKQIASATLQQYTDCDY